MASFSALPERPSLMGSLIGVIIICLAASSVFGQAKIGALDDLEVRSNRVYECEVSDFDQNNYTRAVEQLFQKFETEELREISKGKRGRVGLKVYSDSGPGLATPAGLVEGVVQALLARGYERSDIFVIGMSDNKLRESGFLPPLSQRSFFFNQVFVRSLDSGEYYHEKWFYDRTSGFESDRFLRDAEFDTGTSRWSALELSKKSYLPVPLMHEVDFWINMPCYSDHPILGINGALTNATLWNASNTGRFMRDPSSAPVAVAEMGAIPELKERWDLNIVSLERYQFIGGPIFNSLYTVSEPFVLMSENPVLLDSLMSERINFRRQENGFDPLPEPLNILAYSEQLGLGQSDIALMDLIHAN